MRHRAKPHSFTKDFKRRLPLEWLTKELWQSPSCTGSVDFLLLERTKSNESTDVLLSQVIRSNRSGLWTPAPLDDFLMHYLFSDVSHLMRLALGQPATTISNAFNKLIFPCNLCPGLHICIIRIKTPNMCLYIYIYNNNIYMLYVCINVYIYICIWGPQ